MENNKKKQHMGLRSQKIVSNVVVYVILTLISIIWITPFVCILFESFRVESTGQVGYIIPHQWGVDNYINLFKSTKFGRWYFSTLLMGLFTCVLQTGMVTFMSYTLSRMRFTGRKFLMNAMLVLGMFPGFLSMIVLYRTLGSFGLTNGNAIPGLILVYTASSGMGYYVSKGFFDTIPRSLDEAARIDGATRWQVLYKVIIPMAKPIIIYTILTSFMAPWGDFIFSSFVANATSDGYNVAAGLQNMIAEKGAMAANYTMFCAGGVLIALPITILFMVMQKYYVEGVTGGAVKG